MHKRFIGLCSKRSVYAHTINWIVFYKQCTFTNDSLDCVLQEGYMYTRFIGLCSKRSVHVQTILALCFKRSVHLQTSHWIVFYQKSTCIHDLLDCVLKEVYMYKRSLHCVLKEVYMHKRFIGLCSNRSVHIQTIHWRGVLKEVYMYNFVRQR